MSTPEGNATTVCTDCANKNYRGMKPVKFSKKKPTEHIKVHLPGEWLWAIKLTATTAKLDNMPITGDWAYGDVVEFDPDSMEVTKLVERKYRSGGVTYNIPKGSTDKQIVAAMRPVYKALEKAGILCEGFTAGLLGVAVPLTMTVEQARKIVTDAGAVLHLDEDEPKRKKRKKAGKGKVSGEQKRVDQSAHS
jgi:hypothetical protein